jgi:2-hydroxy-6-oxonona-2,4-dienedioate hydrolase
VLVLTSFVCMGSSHTPTSVALPAADAARTREIVVRGDAGVDVRVQLEESGKHEGVPVVFLHGLVGLNDHWEGVVESVKHQSYCVRVEMPLFGLTDEDCSIDGATTLTIRVLEQLLRGRPAVLVGNSFGGHVAAKIAIRRPDLVRGLVLAGASGVIEKSIVADVQIRPSREWLERKIGELFFDRSKMNQADVDRAYKELNGRASARAMVKLSRTARKNHLGDELTLIKCPTLIVWGREDIVTPPEACETFAKLIPNNTVTWIERCGHAPMIECPKEFGVAMNAYLSGLK